MTQVTTAVNGDAFDIRDGDDNAENELRIMALGHFQFQRPVLDNRLDLGSKFLRCFHADFLLVSLGKVNGAREVGGDGVERPDLADLGIIDAVFSAVADDNGATAKIDDARGNQQAAENNHDKVFHRSFHIKSEPKLRNIFGSAYSTVMIMRR